VNWDDYKFFSTAARQRSVRGAAQELGVHPSTVTRRLDQFEHRLGVRLFERGAAGLTLTADGADVVQRLDEVGRQLEGVERHLLGRDRRLAGPIRITLPDVVAVSLLMDDLERFAATYPDIELELLATYDALDLAHREADVAVRVTSNPPEDRVGRRVGRFTMAVYGSRHYLEGRDPFTATGGCAWIDWAADDPIGAYYRLVHGRHFRRLPVSVRCSNVLLQLAAVRARLGIALLPCAVGDYQDDLVRIDRVAPIVGQELWLLTHPDLRGVGRVHVLMEFLTEAFRVHEQRLTGRP
jgi:DNA-binding transcriptional LysR family regulator